MEFIRVNDRLAVVKDTIVAVEVVEWPHTFNVVLHCVYGAKFQESAFYLEDLGSICEAQLEAARQWNDGSRVGAYRRRDELLALFELVDQ